jgi:hypothetical protein
VRIALKIALVPVAAFTLTGCTAVTEGAPSPEQSEPAQPRSMPNACFMIALTSASSRSMR